jgi:hypothetical protein
MKIAHLEGAMGSSQTVLPFKLAAMDESLTAHGGLALFGEFLHAFGLCGLIDHELPVPGSVARYDPSAHVLPLMLMLAGGGTHTGGFARFAKRRRAALSPAI